MFINVFNTKSNEKVNERVVASLEKVNRLG